MISESGRVAIAELPSEGRLARVPHFSAAPETIKRGSTVAGFYAAKPPRAAHTKPHGPIPHVFSSPEAAKRFTATGESYDPSSEVCFCWVRGFDGDELSGQGWPESGYTSSAVPMRHSYGGPIAVIHGERFRGGSDDSLVLTSTDAWVDIKTRGLQHLADSSIELARLGNSPDDVSLWAARDEHLVHVVIRPSGPRLDLLRVDDPLDPKFSTCGHLRVSLTIPREAGSGAPLTVSVPADATGTGGDALVRLRIARTVAGEAYLWVEDPRSDRYRSSGSAKE